jgi:hypothetical protein
MNSALCFMRFWLSVFAIQCLLASSQCQSVADDDATWKITIGDPTPLEFTGRIIAEVPQSAILLEEKNGKQHQISTQQIQSRVDLGEMFVPFSSAELAADLLRQVPAGFEIFETEHYVLCSNAASEYVKFCGTLLETVFDQYFHFMTEREIIVTQPPRKLPIIIFASAAEFQTFSGKQHPEISFADTPGYFSVRDNQTLLLDLTGDRSIRSGGAIRRRLAEKPLQVATVVHEAVHQLAFNSGLQVRMADNPLWLSEGLAMYFETTTIRSATLWNMPGRVNPRHQPAFIKLLNGNQISGGLNALIASDSTFLNSTDMPAAYARAWALTHYLMREQPTGIQVYFRSLSQRKPMIAMTAEGKNLEFQTAFGKSPDEMEQELVSYIRRQRVSR